MAASTTNPTAKAIPAREMTLIVLPNNAIVKNVVIIEIGIEIATTIIELKERKNKKRTIIAKKPPR